MVFKRFFAGSAGRACAAGLVAAALAIPLQQSVGSTLAASARQVPPSEHLNPQAAAVVNQIVAFHAPPLPLLNPMQARNTPSAQDAAMVVQSRLGKQPFIQPLNSVRHILIPSNFPGTQGSILARVYTPAGRGPFPVLVYFHGGGWVIANLDTYDSSARALAALAHYVVVSVAYRQAPEQKFPAAANDAYAASQWIMAHPHAVNGIPGRVAVGGESAGGNLAAVAALMARNKHGLKPDFQLLVYPITNYNFNTPSYRQEVNAVPLNTAGMQWFWANYLVSPVDGSNPYASPLRAKSLAGLPPALVITDENDPLRSEGTQYAYRLRRAGVRTTLTQYNGVMHEFFGMGAVIDTAKQAEMQAAAALQAAAKR